MERGRGPANAAVRGFIDAVYCSPDNKFWLGYATVIALLWGLALLFLAGWLTDWPAQPARLTVDSYTASCANGKPTDEITNDSVYCGSGTEQDEKAAAAAVDGWVRYLDPRNDGTAAVPANSVGLAQTNSFFAAWLDRNICQRDATAADRSMRARVIRDTGVCGATAAWTDVTPLAIWWGTPGLLLTLLLMVGGTLLLLRHILVLRDTREAYRLLYGTNHRRR